MDPCAAVRETTAWAAGQASAVAIADAPLLALAHRMVCTM